jgi:hypothetical protein
MVKVVIENDHIKEDGFLAKRPDRNIMTTFPNGLSVPAFFCFDNTLPVNKPLNRTAKAKEIPVDLFDKLYEKIEGKAPRKSKKKKPKKGKKTKKRR